MTPSRSCSPAPNPIMMDELHRKAANGRISCTAMRRLVASWNYPPSCAAALLDAEAIRLVACSLGLFDKTAAPSPDLEIPTGVLLSKLSAPTCSEVRAFARMRNLPPVSVSRRLSELGIRIRSCELGVF